MMLVTALDYLLEILGVLRLGLITPVGKQESARPHRVDLTFRLEHNHFPNLKGLKSEQRNSHQLVKGK
jgi:hypothetical protein